MKYVIDKEKRPVYLQIYNQIRYDISTVTVEHAYSLLSDEGCVESRERSGYVVSLRKADGFASPAKTTITLYI